ncbi:DNA-binding transcriptional LysR family regulator [Variovorax boronicumulans]|uniref:DNA-binding transcriptional LysR family regulator n=1 Tax=Variovorax boronicumulans TaxID=436515 RepID=A0AAW8CY06_9BURK|nr:LysR family transcriptional regulator [Variovorax boronicumulans]MDP9893777.1 DNA-binding transcriptional LysR family regulator [Variovorax boronicumulans]MDP9993320.1 DNA-binding transcriptional LysR family regulator [Variovorax boronicumulans]MDQ0004813.1 DNA-binding transcriptional LysR family regulator [Variovorax boronicumulans]MDQ0053594.1 DNA-binding transcriptional LysR family regulator [Variovorax boronicumulans]
MDTRFLQSFVAVVDCGSVADASRRLDLPATTVTQQMRSLEADIGCQLLTRVGRTVKPTVVGARLVDQAREVLRGVRELRSAASDTGLPAGPLRLGATPTALMGMVPALLRRWMSAHPTIQVYIEPGTSSKLLEQVVSGNLDVAILVHPTFAMPKTCEWRVLRSEALILLAPREMTVRNPLLTAAREPFILYDRKVVAGKMADEYLRSRGIKPKVRFELDGIEHIAQLVAEGFGVSILPDWPAVGKSDGRTKRYPLPPPCPSREVGMVWSRASLRSPLADALYALVERK